MRIARLPFPLAFALALLAGLMVPLLAAAQTVEESPSASLDRWESEAKDIERQLEFAPPPAGQIEGLLATLGAQLDQIPITRERLEASLAPIRDQRVALGEPPEDPASEPDQVTTERQRLDGEIAVLDGLARRTDQAEARAEGLIERLIQLRRDRFREQLLTKGPNFLDPQMPQRALAAIQRTGSSILLETSTRLEMMSVDLQTISRLALPLMLLIGGLVIGLKLRSWALGWLLAQLTADCGRSRRISIGAGITLVRLLLPVWSVGMVFAGIALTGLLGFRGTLFLEGAAAAAIVVIGAYALGGAYYAPHATPLRLARLSDEDARAASRWLILLALAVGLDRLLVRSGDALRMAVEGLALLNAAVLVLGGVALFGVAHYLRRPMPEEAPAQPTPAAEDEEEGTQTAQGGRTLLAAAQWVARLAAISAPVLAILGYYAASRHVFYPLVLSGAVIALCLLLFHVVQAIVMGRRAAGDTGSDRLRVLPLLVGFLLGSAAIPVIALIWGVTPSDLNAAWRRMTVGFQVGDITISPGAFLMFLMVAVIGVVVTGQVKRVLRGSVLPVTGIDAGGRDAITAGVGYFGLVITVLIAASASGLDLSNLAIVAGALSVGIGFGLQNIVNNFVSGIILLIERPIKPGDWIELPSGMGYVKTINVRSTVVETFDRSALFVPNSQLISENVINWTHSNLHGRIIVKVGVDYGSDPRKVERVLLEIARAHPLMLRRPAPYVLFRGFGADSLEFEIRGVLRDVNWILNVQSDINFEIARRFREEGIEIPFRQADIALKNVEEIAALLQSLQAQNAVPKATASPAAETPSPRRHSEAAGHDPDGPGDIS
ncbi:MAG: DUF3772 domain-containing protein [Pikeienuella sp.]